MQRKEACEGMKTTNTDKKLIISLTKTFKLFKPPCRIGEVTEYENDSYLIIGIEKVRFFGSNLKVTYTCQNLNVLHALPTRQIGNCNYSEFYTKINTKDYLETDWITRNDRDNLIRLGGAFEYKGSYYRWITYSDLKFDFTTLELSALAESIHPVNHKTARSKLISSKRKKLDLAVIK